MLTLDERESSTPVGPEACALCIGIPLDRDAISACLAEPERHGYISGILKEKSASTIDELWPIYQSQVVKPVDAACKKFEGMGVTVKRSTMIHDIVRLTHTKHVLLLWTHWEAPRFIARQIKAPRSVVRIAQVGEHWVHKEVGNALIGIDKKVSSRQDIADALNRLIEVARLEKATALDWASNIDQLKPTHSVNSDVPLVTRVLIEQQFGNAINVGTPLELSDGMHSVWQLLESIPKDRWLILDLTMCNSTELAEVARSTHPRMRVIGHYESADVASGALVVNQTLQNLLDQSQSYLQARVFAVQQILERLKAK